MCVQLEKGRRMWKMVEAYKPLYTVEAVATVLLTNTDTVYDLIRKRELRALKLGRTKIRGSDLEEFIEGYPEINTKEG